MAQRHAHAETFGVAATFLKKSLLTGEMPIKTPLSQAFAWFCRSRFAGQVHCTEYRQPRSGPHEFEWFGAFAAKGPHVERSGNCIFQGSHHRSIGEEQRTYGLFQRHGVAQQRGQLHEVARNFCNPIVQLQIGPLFFGAVGLVRAFWLVGRSFGK